MVNGDASRQHTIKTKNSANCTNLQQLVFLDPVVQRKGQCTAPVHEGHATAEQPAHEDGSQVLSKADGDLELVALSRE